MSLILSWVNLEKHSQTLLKRPWVWLLRITVPLPGKKKKVKILGYKREPGGWGIGKGKGGKQFCGKYSYLFFSLFPFLGHVLNPILVHVCEGLGRKWKSNTSLDAFAWRWFTFVWVVVHLRHGQMKDFGYSGHLSNVLCLFLRSI